MPSTSENVKVRTLDGLTLAGTLVLPATQQQRSLVMVHGGGVTREEGGFFTRLAEGVAESGVASLRFDLRGHGESGGRQQDLTLSMVLNDIRVVADYLRQRTGHERVCLLGTSFGGGITGYYAGMRPSEVQRLVLLNPQFDYKKRTIDSRAYWTNDQLDAAVAHELAERGYIDFTPTFKHGSAIFNEVFWLKPHENIHKIQAPTLVVHGTHDTFVDIENSRAAINHLTAEHRLLEIDGAQHGFAVHDDPHYLHPQSQVWQAEVIKAVKDWLIA
ncbi:alpha-beta hydrolase superfamily lysophospholipase [Actinokineospora baliensis]|uniref:alpha/beta hydrolase n=1 Tax=Actinokineospora baliensis TaxID=547056 RepID=UPI0027DE5202|nr:alpha/beta fold hydrolase [Actinokineospora baliensis]MBM7774311.1 alpha-beta hydrolase superfamily lysophospholipase [Actinokineospora baliensis]